jgi:hypothetical protein
VFQELANAAVVAQVSGLGAAGRRRVQEDERYRLPGDEPWDESVVLAAVPAAAPASALVKEVEALVCRNLEITMDGEVATERALDMFASMFKYEISADAIRALRVLFKLDSAQESAIEEAMLARGGVAALEQLAAKTVDVASAHA